MTLFKANHIAQIPLKEHHENVVFQQDGVEYFCETSDEFDFFGYCLEEVIINTTTEFQKVLIADTNNYGRILVLDGAIQSAEDDEELYHEALVQPAMLAHEAPKQVLIIGGGEGATLREILKHQSVEKVVMVDIDRAAVELCIEHLDDWHRDAFFDARVELVFEDGREYLEKEDRKFDIAIIDVVDMLDNGPAQRLYTRQFYELLTTKLNKHAVVAVQGMEFSHQDTEQHCALRRTLKSVFSQVHSYRTTIPSFLSAWGFLIASDWFDPLQFGATGYDASISKKLETVGLKHVDGNFLIGCFHLCKETVRIINLPGPLLEDGVEFIHLH